MAAGAQAVASAAHVLDQPDAERATLAIVEVEVPGPVSGSISSASSMPPTGRVFGDPRLGTVGTQSSRVHSRAQAVVEACRLGLATPDFSAHELLAGPA